jgi:ferric-dicitrate binding protein FerR (iron transport regulator)
MYTGDSLETGPLSQASVALRFGSEVRVNENSILQIVPGRKESDCLRLEMGQVWTRLLHRNAALEVRTPAAICAIRGTEADIEQGAMLTVKVYEGHVDVRNDKGRQSLTAGQLTIVPGAGAAPAAVRPMSDSDKARWQENVKSGNVRAYLRRLEAAGKNLRIRVRKDGKVKDVEIKVKKR